MKNKHPLDATPEDDFEQGESLIAAILKFLGFAFSFAVLMTLLVMAFHP